MSSNSETLKAIAIYKGCASSVVKALGLSEGCGFDTQVHQGDVDKGVLSKNQKRKYTNTYRKTWTG